MDWKKVATGIGKAIVDNQRQWNEKFENGRDKYSSMSDDEILDRWKHKRYHGQADGYALSLEVKSRFGSLDV